MEELEEDILKNEPYLSSKRTKMRAMAQYRGFSDEYEYEGWRYFNSLGSENTRHILDIYSHNNGNSE
jgi:UDP-glucose 4-epimerase